VASARTRARCRRGRAAPAALGQSRKELRFRFHQRQESARRSVRRQKPLPVQPTTQAKYSNL